MLVRELMTESVVTLSPDDTLQYAARKMLDEDVGMLPVCKNGKLVGVVTDRDITLRAVANSLDAAETKVRDVMSTNTLSVSPLHRAEDAAKIMSVAQFRRLPVIENDFVVGIIALGDLANSRRYATEAAEALSEITKERS